jgi:hypothetical protein
MNASRKKCRAFCNKTVKKRVTRALKMMKFHKQTNTTRIKESVFTNRLKRSLSDTCNEQHCNVGCKNTLFEKGKGNVLPKAYAKYARGLLDKHDRDLLDVFRRNRKEMFGKDTNVLDEDSFYKNINYLGTGKNKLSKKKLMKMGAISGCLKYSW